MQVSSALRVIVFVLVCLAFGEASAQSTRPLYVFDDDAACDVVDVTLTPSGPVDASGRYRVVFLSPWGDAAWPYCGCQNRFQDTVIALVGWHADGSVDPIVRWEDARLLIRPGENCPGPWKGLPRSDKSRKARFEWPPESAWPTGTQLWGIKVPAAMRACTCFEAYGFLRPDWQRGVCRMFEFTSTTPVQLVTNRRSTDPTAETQVVGGSLAFAHTVTPHAGIARFFFAPKDAVNEGDVTVLTGPGTTVAWNCSGNVTSQSLFPSVNATKRSDGGKEPVLLVGVGGQNSAPSQFSSISGTLTFPDGEQIQFQGKTLNGCYIEWPGHCDTSGVISIQDAAAQTASGTVSLATTSFEIVKADKELVGPSGVRVKRLGTTCPTAPQVAFGGTASFTLLAVD